MANRLTQIIMGNMVDKYTHSKKSEIQTTNLSSKEEKIIRNIIHKESSRNIKMESKIESNNKASKNHITLEELISKSIGGNQEERSLKNEKKKDLHSKVTNKVGLEDIVPRVSLASIGKKPRDLGV